MTSHKTARRLRAGPALCFICRLMRHDVPMWQGRYRLEGAQWGVGHGGLNLQTVTFQRLRRNPTRPVGAETTLRVVYDCGSGRGTNPRQAMLDAITRMLSAIPKGGSIDVLAISHFDKDHINGLELLRTELKNHGGVTVKRIWSPVLTPQEALFAVGSVGATAGLMSPASYAAILSNPTEALQERFPDAVVSAIPTTTEPIPLESRATFVDTDGGDTDGEDAEVADSAIHPGLTAGAAAGSHHEQLWEVVPYVVDSTLVGSAAVNQHAAGLIGKPLEQCSISDLQTILSDQKLVAGFHAAVLANHKSLTVNQRQSSARTAPNLSTMCVYSGPVDPYRWARHRRGWNSLPATPVAVPSAPSWLGTGDIGFTKPSHVQAMETALGRSRLDRVGIVSTPHHGSRLDSGPVFWDAVPNADLATIEADHAQGQKGNSHPHIPVIDELSERGIRIGYATVGNDVTWADTGIR